MATPAPITSPTIRAVVVENKKRTAVKVVTTLCPRIPKVTTVLLDFYVRREGVLDVNREPLDHFCLEQVMLAAQDILEKTNRQVITYQDIRDSAENLINLHNFCYKRAQDTAHHLGESIRKMMIIIAELATALENISEVTPTDWVGVGNTVLRKTAQVNMAQVAPFWTYIPKMSDFSVIKLLGAGGFGAVYKARFEPTNYICTVKLVSCALFQRHKQAVIDKVVASVIKSPFLVKYDSCYCTKEAQVTVMEYISGVDLQRVVDKAVYLPTEQCRIVMAQLILALEHMHLRGLLHRDIKVSNMLIIPGGRVKVIDFDTNKVCIGHFSKRVYKGYFTKTAFEFFDGESAGTVPYMAPEIVKRRPYGRACDWWSAGVTFYKIMTGRVPFRGESKEQLKERILNQPLKWPKEQTHPHSATPEAKDMVTKMLQKNALHRLGSVTYGQIRSHPFYANFNWKRLASERNLCNIPAIAEIMGAGQPVRPGERPRLTVEATSNTKKRKLLKLEEMADIEASTQRPLYTFSSRKFRKMINYAQMYGSPAYLKDVVFDSSETASEELDYGRPSEWGVRSGASAYSGAAGSPVGLREVTELLLFRTKRFGKYWNFGFSLAEVVGEAKKRFFMVDTVRSGSPADASRVLVGDIVVAVNGKDIAGLTMADVKRTIEASGDQMALTVLSSTAVRLLMARRDVNQLIRAAGEDTIQLRAVKTSCGGAGYYGFKTFQAKTWNEAKQAFVNCHVIQEVADAQVVTLNKSLFPGDLLLMINGASVENMDQTAVKAALCKGGNEISVTIVPMSPLRIKGPAYYRLLDYTTTDINGPEPSVKAKISLPAPSTRA
ncbi:hypothetical protein HPB48_010439 [Haemaphysalis longicornis]|uniref:Serine/threonine-protein kinase greatwall n=1 Tax=Haemaphysalis longicornis TaxID=44386 RepID=A0A9J6GIA0_HAELO|nr:hypothetical protein HPB48_010439 [Haemaphysalis longicornis]